MKFIRVDLHCHSHYAGGASQSSLNSVAEVQELKGIHLVGTGDCLHPEWFVYLKNNLIEYSKGLYTLKEFNMQGDDSFLPLFCLQTELVITAPSTTDNKYRRSVFHIIVLFPSFESVAKAQRLLDKWNVRNTIGRPTIKCDDIGSISQRIIELKSIDPFIEVILAHVMTRDGILGDRNKVSYAQDLLGEAYKLISAVETGLSANLEMLSLIPELEDFSFLSFSDAHSADISKLGREYSVLEVENYSYKSLIDAIQNNQILHTFEMHPAEGKYFLSGHSPKRHGGKHPCVFGPNLVPKDRICPYCGKKLEAGVLERVFELSRIQFKKVSSHLPKKKRSFITGVPLAEMISVILEKPVNTQAIADCYANICNTIGSEAEFWESSTSKVLNALSENYDEDFLKKVKDIKEGNYCFDLPGFDGVFGALKIGSKKIDYQNYQYVPKGYTSTRQLSLWDTRGNVCIIL